MKTIQKNKKRKSFELRRLVALLCALVVPALYIISIILIITEKSIWSVVSGNIIGNFNGFLADSIFSYKASKGYR